VPAHPVRFVTATALFDGHDAGRRGRDGARGRVAVRDDPEFGAPSQLEKIDMLDFADVVAVNKFERRGAADALRDVSRQLIRNREAFGARPEDMPVFGTSAATFNDTGVTALYQHLAEIAATVRGYHEKTTEPGPTGMKGLDIIPL
jgi:putative protein kinase ArgK-like GTPase of G3E family